MADVESGPVDLTRKVARHTGETAADTGTPTSIGPRVPTADEKKRGEIATLLTVTLVGVVIVVGIAAIWVLFRGCTNKDSCDALKANVESLKLVLEIVVTPLVGLVGAVTGFYFGGKAAELGK